MNINKRLIPICIILIILLSYCTNILAAKEQPISFMQDDSKWGSELYSITNSKSQTIATSGCGPTSAAMVLNYYIDNEITPLSTVEYALKNNHRTYNDGTSWAYFSDIAQAYGLDFLQTSSADEALQWMETKKDPLIICSMGRGLWTMRGHYILLWDVKDGVAYINDPASTRDDRICNSYDYMASQCRQYFCFDRVLPNDLVMNMFFKSLDDLLIC